MEPRYFSNRFTDSRHVTSRHVTSRHVRLKPSLGLNLPWHSRHFYIQPTEICSAKDNIEMPELGLFRKIFFSSGTRIPT